VKVSLSVAASALRIETAFVLTEGNFAELIAAGNYLRGNEMLNGNALAGTSRSATG